MLKYVHATGLMGQARTGAIAAAYLRSESVPLRMSTCIPSLLLRSPHWTRIWRVSLLLGSKRNNQTR